MSPEAEHRLAAILSGDVVGYSRLMSEDEESTVARVAAYREEIELLIRQHRGRLVDFTGDNFLAEFTSALGATNCAVQIQRAIGARNVELPPERKLEFRLGVHVADVRVEGERIFGDGVNVAARLEGLAEPGGVCISAAVHEQVRRRLALDFEDLGPRTVKNIPDPVHPYRVRMDRPPEPARGTSREGEPSVAVLPFVNMSADPEQDYFGDGIAEELIGALTRVPGLRVIARTSAFSFKQSDADVATIGRKLGVRTLVEGSVRRAGDRLRIAAQLIDVEGGHHLWSETYDRSLDDVFEIQDEIARSIVEKIRGRLLGETDAPLVRRTTTSQEAYDLYLRSGERIGRFNRWDMRTAIMMLENATEIDPHFAAGHARLALACCYMDFHFDPGWHDPTESAMRRAEELDPDNAEVHLVRGRWLWTPRQGFQNARALRSLEESLRLRPGLHEAQLWRGAILLHVGLLDEGRAALEEALASLPEDPTALGFLGQLAWAQGHLDEAEDLVDRSRARDPSHYLGSMWRAPIRLYMDDLAGAEEALGASRERLGRAAMFDSCEALLWAKRGEPERAKQALARITPDRPRLGHEHHTAHFAAATWALLGDAERCTQNLREAADTGFPNYPKFREDPHLDPARSTPAMAGLMSDLETRWNEYRREFGRTD